MSRTPGCCGPHLICPRPRWEAGRRRLPRGPSARAGALDGLSDALLRIEAQPADFVQVGTGDPTEPRAVRIVDRVDRADIEESRLARREAVPLRDVEFGRRRIAGVVQAAPLGHVGVAARLAVDRPRTAVVFRRRVAPLAADG